MRQTLLVVMIVTLSALHAWSQIKQQGQVKICILGKDTQQPLAGATAVLLYAKDSSRAVSAFSDKKGDFVLDGVKKGEYKLYVTYLGYQSILRSVTITNADTIINLGSIPMQRTSVTLEMVEIVEARSPMVIKNDTLEFNADYYKTRENAVMEELLRKLPGVQVEKDGTIKVNGETVKKVLVDGKPFFGDNSKLATRNLPADMIDKVQLIDRKSDQAQFSGMNDGNTEKAINITVKKDRKKGFLGRMSVSYGTDKRFAVNGNLNQFRDEQQLSFLGSGNNVNGYPDRQAGEGGGSNGITRNWNEGANYNKDFSKKLKLSGSYVVNDSRMKNQRNSARQNLLPDTTYYYNQDASSLNNHTDHNLAMRVEYKPDTIHNLILATNFSYISSNNLQENLYKSLGNKQQLINSGTMHNYNTNIAPNFSAAVFFGKRFRKPGRTFTTSLDISYNKNDLEAFNKSYNLFMQPNGDTYTDTMDQRNDHSVQHRIIALYFIHTEPIFKDRFLEFTYSYTRDHASSRKFMYDYNASKKDYDRLNDSLSNSFDNVSILQQAGVGIRTQKIKYDYSVGLNIQFSDLKNNNISQHNHLQQHSVNFSPSASFNYAFTKKNTYVFLIQETPCNLVLHSYSQYQIIAIHYTFNWVTRV